LYCRIAAEMDVLPGLPCAQRQPESVLLYQIIAKDASFQQKSALCVRPIPNSFAE